MRIIAAVVLIGALAASGCARRKASPPPAQFAPVGPLTPAPANDARFDDKLIVTPARPLVGKVARVNATSRYVVLSFPLGHLPAMGQVMSLYRRGLKVGEVKVNGPQQDENVVADLVTGEAEVGDEAREN
jgi:hypothetical protein